MLRSLLNQRLGRYYIKELLGRGGMAVVYKASDTVLQRDVALKVLYPQFSDDAALVERFKREAVTAASLEHPNIVPVYDVGEQDGMVYIAMKLLSGRTLQDRLQEAGAIAIDELVAVLEPVAAALDYAHGRGVIHRDIKPGNVFLSQEADGIHPLLTDFGIAKQLHEPGLTTTGALIGTPDYMAPEQIAGRVVDGRVDVYALGMLSFRALAGRRAFDGSTQDVLLGHLYGSAPSLSALNPAVPPGLDDVIARAIAAEPAGRYPTAGAFAQALRQVARGEAAITAVGAPAVTRSSGQVASAAGPATTAVGSLPPRVGMLQAGGRNGPPPPSSAGAARVAPHDRPGGWPPTEADPPASAAARRGTGAVPWLLAVALALVAGGLAVALAVVMGEQTGGAGLTAVPPPPTDPSLPTLTATAEPPSPTGEPAVVATATSELSATALPASPTPELATATPVPATQPPPPPPATATDMPTPSATATATATATLTPETPTAVAGCDTSLLTGGFERLYDTSGAVRAGLGCPLRRERAGDGSQQFFAQGMMFYWDDSNRDERADYIFVFYGRDSGRYDELSNEAVQDLGPEPTPGPDPNQPVRGFGTVYFNKAGARDLLGEPTSPELELSDDQRGVVQYFEQGMMIWTPDYRPTGGQSIFVLYSDGTFERYDDPSTG